MARIGRPKGSKNKPKWLKEALAMQPKRPRGRPRKGQELPKTIPEAVAKALSENVAKPAVPPRPKLPGTGEGNPTLNDVPPEVRSERARKAALAGVERRKALGVPLYIPAGWTLEQVAVLQEMAKEHTKRIINIMADAGVLPEDEGAQEAMGTVLGIMRTSQSFDMKLKAARTVLEYTKSKPVAKHDHTVRTAEDFLDDLAKEEGDTDE